jgi:predicted Fe-S protein YdhL (DUF1289 family)
MTEREKLYWSQLTPEERKEVRATERRLIAEVRSWQRAAMKEREAIRKSMPEAEWRAYEHEKLVRFCEEHGMKWS